MRIFTSRFGKSLLNRAGIFAILGLSAIQAQAQVYQTFVIDPGNGQNAETRRSVGCPADQVSNFFGTDFMRARYENTITCNDEQSVSYLQFNLSGALPNAIITNATLQLFYPAGSLDFSTIGNNEFFVQRVLNPWFEGSITWNTAPGFTVAGQAFQPAGSTPTENWNTNITDIAREWFCNGQANEGLRIELQNTGPYRNANFATSLHANNSLHPTLVLEWATVTISSPTPLPICQGSTVTLDAQINGIPGAYTYTWFDNFGNFLGNTPTISPTVNVNTTYTVWIDFNGCRMSTTYQVDPTYCCTPSGITTPYTKFHNKSTGPMVPVNVWSKIGMDANGNTYTPGTYNNYTDGAVLQIQQNGVNGWNMVTGDPGYPEYFTSTVALAGGSGDIAVAGFQDVGPWPYNRNVVVQRVDAAGNQLWSRVYFQNSHLIHGVLITQVANGDLVIAANIQTISSWSYMAIFVVDVNTGLPILYREENLGLNFVPFVEDIEPTNDGGFVVAGHMFENTQSWTNSFNSGMLCKYDAAYNLTWNRTYRNNLPGGIYNLNGGAGPDYSDSRFTGVIQNTAGFYVTCGYAMLGSYFPQGWMTIIDPAGNMINAQLYPSPNASNVNFFEDIAQAANGDYLVTGYTNNPMATATIIRFDGALNSVFYSEHTDPDPQANLYGTHIFETAAQNIIVQAHTQNNTPGVDPAPTIIGTDASGYNGCEIYNSLSPTTNPMSDFFHTPTMIPVNVPIINIAMPWSNTDICYNEVCPSQLRSYKPGKQGSGNSQNGGNMTLGIAETDGNQFKVYPVPANQLLTIDLGSAAGKELKVEITDLLGKAIISQAVTGGAQFAIPVAELPNGLYLLNISEGSQVLHTQKVSIAH